MLTRTPSSTKQTTGAKNSPKQPLHCTESEVLFRAAACQRGYRQGTGSVSLSLCLSCSLSLSYALYLSLPTAGPCGYAGRRLGSPHFWFVHFHMLTTPRNVNKRDIVWSEYVDTVTLTATLTAPAATLGCNDVSMSFQLRATPFDSKQSCWQKNTTTSFMSLLSNLTAEVPTFLSAACQVQGSEFRV